VRPVDEAAPATGEAFRGLRGVLEHEARGQVERLGVLVELTADGSRPHAKGGKIEFSHKKTQSFR